MYFYAKNNAWLIDTTINLNENEAKLGSDGKFLFSLGKLPKGARVVLVNVAVKTAGTGNFKVGFEETADFFHNDVDLMKVTQTTSHNQVTLSKTEEIYLQVDAKNAGVVETSVMFFMPNRAKYEA